MGIAGEKKLVDYMKQYRQLERIEITCRKEAKFNKTYCRFYKSKKSTRWIANISDENPSKSAHKWAE